MLAIGLIEDGSYLFSTDVETDDAENAARILGGHATRTPDQVLIVALDSVVAHYNRGEDYGEDT